LISSPAIRVYFEVRFAWEKQESWPKASFLKAGLPTLKAKTRTACAADRDYFIF